MPAKAIYKGSEPTKFKKVKLHKDDEVVVIAGKDKGKKGKILALDKKRDRVFIEGVNKRKRFVRPTQENPQGGQIEIEFPLHISNVMFFDSKKKKGVRLGSAEVKGKKVRVTKPEGREI
ncbi:50S ribosomal protein L24 [Leptospira sp. GIMC2001]|uniref:50S ribosomal protein L24 n=1 Tax=Leptospira sp. GIMC2001 TaxID=1513297 RepID=UPI00234B87A5|nr:50S ribosomal protein L24 [Leptospira sp. GIMC2001]WCL51091.1 50S ribosomal protein L24 [Leptospira sp. GIMC2001]